MGSGQVSANEPWAGVLPDRLLVRRSLPERFLRNRVTWIPRSLDGLASQWRPRSSGDAFYHAYACS